MNCDVSMATTLCEFKDRPASPHTQKQNSSRDFMRTIHYSPDTCTTKSYKTLPTNAIKSKEIKGLWRHQKWDLNTFLFTFLRELLSSFDIPALICHKEHIKLEFNDEILCH